MASLNEHHHVVMILFFLLILMSSSSYARLLNGFHGSHSHLQDFAATEPSLNLELPGQSIHETLKTQPTYDSPHDLSCNMKTTQNSVAEVSPAQKLGQQYTSLWLNFLPRGDVPPSGPSGRTNNINGWYLIHDGFCNSPTRSKITNRSWISSRPGPD